MAKAEEYLTSLELSNLGLASVGRHVFVSRRAIIAYPNRTSIGDRVRIDDFTLITGASTVQIGSNVHLGTSVTVNAVAPVVIGNYSGIAAGVKLFTADDNYSGRYLTGPTVTPEHSEILTEKVEIGFHCVVGANSVLLPGAYLEDGVVIGALSLVKGRLPAWGIYAGAPVRFIRPRSRELIKKAEAETLSHKLKGT